MRLSMIDFFRGFWAPFRAFQFVFNHRITVVYLVPLLLWVLLVFGTTWSLASWLHSILLGSFEDPNNLENMDGSFWASCKSWIQAGLKLTSAWILPLVLWIFLGRVMKYLILILMSPVLAWVSEKTENLISGEAYAFRLDQFLLDIWRGIRITMRNLIVELSFMVLGFFVGLFLPFLSAIIAVFLFLLNSYFMGFSMFDYISERKRLDISDSVKSMRRNRWMVTGLGISYNLISMIPFADWVVAPINGAVGAVLCSQNLKIAHGNP